MSARHPNQSELGKLWALERQMNQLRREYGEKLQRLGNEIAAACEELQDACGVGPGTTLDSAAGKWIKPTNPKDPSAGGEVITFTGEE